MANTKLQPTLTQRVMYHLAEGNSALAIAHKLRDEELGDYTKDRIHKEIKRILRDPILTRMYEIERRAVSLRKISWLAQVAEDNLEKLKEKMDLYFEHLESINIDTRQAIILKTLSDSMQTWWKNLAEIHGAIKRDEVTLNLTQVNVEQVNVANSNLLGVIQDIMRWLPTDKRNLVLERISEIEVPKDSNTVDGDG